MLQPVNYLTPDVPGLLPWHDVPLVIATDGMKDEVETNLWQKLIFRSQGAGPSVTTSSGTFRSVTHQSDKTELRVLLTDLSQLVESTLLVDRNSGLSFDKMMRKV